MANIGTACAHDDRTGVAPCSVIVGVPTRVGVLSAVAGRRRDDHTGVGSGAKAPDVGVELSRAVAGRADHAELHFSITTSPVALSDKADAMAVARRASCSLEYSG